MSFDIFYKLSRKILPLSIYQSFSKSVFGRERAWKRIETYFLNFEFYSEQRLALKGKTVMEVGCGNQYYTALLFLNLGAEKVFLVEPTFTPDLRKLTFELKAFNLYASKTIALSEIQDRIYCFSDLTNIPSIFNSKIHFAFSYLVLEHFHDIESFFLNTQRLLRQGGTSCNFVDLSDHTYHLLAKYPIFRKFAERRVLFHLRYSERLFAFINDSKCYMNRKLLPEYFALTSKYGMVITEIKKWLFGRSSG